MFAKPQEEHNWLAPLLGDWEFTHFCSPGPDQDPLESTGKVMVRSLGGMWYLLESTGRMPEGDDWSSVMTLGFDPQQNRYIGSFVGSMMSHFWIYSGELDSTGKILKLSVEGPKFDGSGMTLYEDSIEIISDDEWYLRSKILTDEGDWIQFMEGRHCRVRS